MSSSILPTPSQSREPNGWTERASARLVEDIRALLRVDGVAFVTVDEEQRQMTRAAGWFANPELDEALQPLAPALSTTAGPAWWRPRWAAGAHCSSRVWRPGRPRRTCWQS